VRKPADFEDFEGDYVSSIQNIEVETRNPTTLGILDSKNGGWVEIMVDF